VGIVNGIFVFNGTPQNGASAKLWSLDAFASYADSGDTVQDAGAVAIDSIELNVVAGAGFAVDDVIRIETELCKIWFINTNLLYIIRGWRGTAPAAHANGIPIYDETITAPAEDDAEPGAGQVGGAVTTGVTYGGDGAYRWTAVAEGEYYGSVEYDGHRCFFHHLTERDDPTLDQITRTRGDIIFRGVDGVNRLPKGVAAQLLTQGANDPVWADPSILGLSVIVPKTADETMNNDIGLQNDDHLFFAVLANTVWVITFLLRSTDAAGASLRVACTLPAAGAMYWVRSGDIAALAAATDGMTPVDATVALRLNNGGAPEKWHYLYCLYIGGGNAGTVQLQWAQFTAQVGNTVLLQNSYLIAHEVV